MVVLDPNVKAGLGRCLKSWRNWGLSGQENYRRGNNLVLDSERILRASAAAIMMFCKGK